MITDMDHELGQAIANPRREHIRVSSRYSSTGARIMKIKRPTDFKSLIFLSRMSRSATSRTRYIYMSTSFLFCFVWSPFLLSLSDHPHKSMM